MTYTDFIDFGVSAFGAGLVIGIMIGVVQNFLRSFGHH